jgi:hypothetical protein
MAYAVEGARRPTVSPVPPIQDVSLDRQGTLQGQLVDANGKPVAAASVSLRQNGQVAGRAATDRTGQFTFANTRTGVYEIAAAGTNGVYRVWTAEAAPPAANGKVLLVDKGDVVRGQENNARRLLLCTGLILGAGVIGGVIGYNIKDDDAS